MTNNQAPKQLTLLLPPSEAPLRFRLDVATRRRGLQHIAEIRQLLAERQLTRASAEAGDSIRQPIRPRAA